MSYPPPPGLQQGSSLPPRPPPPATTGSSVQPAYSAAPSYASSGTSSGYGGTSGAGYGAFTAFQPRSVASNQAYRTTSPVVSAPPVPPSGFTAPTTASYGNYYPQAQPSYQARPSYYSQPQYTDASYAPAVPQIQNPFGNDPSNPYGARGGIDAEAEAQIAQWQSAYVSKDDTAAAKAPIRREGTQAASGANTPSGVGGSTPQVAGGRDKAPATVVRSGGGQSWTDPTLLEWDPAHFRLFVGNIAGEVTDDSLFKAFSRYSSVQKARVIRDKRTQKSKGYGFVSFSDGDDYFKAAREMQGKYIGSHPVLLRRATTEVRPVSTTQLKQGKKGGGGSDAGKGGGKVKHDGVKKQKTKGGLKILG